MKAVFGIFSLVIVLALVGWIARRQLSTVGATGVATTTTASQASPRAIEDEARAATARALQQGVQRNDAAER